MAASAPSIIAPATTSNAAPQACSYSGPPGLAGDLGHRGDQHRPDDGIVLRLRAVRDMPGAELAQLRNDRVEVAKRLAQQDERAEEHRLLPLQVRVREQRLHRGSSCEEPGVEDVHQLVAAWSDEVEARLECVKVEAHRDLLDWIRM